MKAKKLMAVFCAMIFVLSAAGCSSANEADTEAVKAAVDKFRRCESFSIVQLTSQQETASMDGEKQQYNGSKLMELSMITGDEISLKTTTVTTVEHNSETVEQSVSSYIFSENGVYTEYFSNGGQWYKLSSDDASLLSGIGAEAVAASFYTDGMAFGRLGVESLGAVEAVRYEGKLSGDALLNMMGSNGMLSSISSMSVNQQQKILENLLKDLGKLTVCIWVDESSGYPVHFEADMTELLEDMEKSIAKTLGTKPDSGAPSITECVISMSLSDFNAVEDIVLPSEAVDAKPYEVN